VTINYVKCLCREAKNVSRVPKSLRPSSMQRKKKKQEQNKLYVGVDLPVWAEFRRAALSCTMPHCATATPQTKNTPGLGQPQFFCQIYKYSEVRRLSYTGRCLSKTRSFGCHGSPQHPSLSCPIIACMNQSRQTHGTAVVRQFRGAHSKRGMRLDALAPRYMVETTSRIRVGRVFVPIGPRRDRRICPPISLISN
jgi:hypothetical protein